MVVGKDLYEGVSQGAYSKKAEQIKRLKIEYRVWANVMSYNFTRESAYRKKHKIPRTQREIPLEPSVPEAAYFDFIDSKTLNNPVSVIAGGDYGILINRIRFARCLRPKSNYVYVRLRDVLEEEDIRLNEEESEILD